MGKRRDSNIENSSKKRQLEDHFLTSLKNALGWDGKGKCKSKFPSIIGFGLKSMNVGKGNRLAAIL